MANTGLIIRTQDARRLPGAAAYVLPGSLSTGLQFMHILMDGLDNALRNWAEGKPNATASGAVGVHDGYLSFVATAAFLRTGVADMDTGTLLFAGRDTGATTSLADAPVFVGTYGGGGAASGSNIFNQAGGLTANATYTVSGSTAPRAAQATKAVQGAWNCLMSDWSPAAVHLFNKTTGGQGTTPLAGATRVANGLNYGIGSGGPGGGAFGGSCDGILCMGWNRVLTGDERDLAYGVAKLLAATAGIAV